MGEGLRNTMYFKKVLAWVLVLSLTITFVQWPQTVRANEESQSQETNKAEVLDETEDGTREIVGELEEQRTESAKQFLMKDGTVVVVQYETDVHYQNEEGQ